MTAEAEQQQSADTAWALQIRQLLDVQEKASIEALGPCDADVEEVYVDIPSPSGSALRAKVIRCTRLAPNERPLIVLMHGGGFCAGSPEQLTQPGRDFASAFGAVVVSVGYRRTPEHRFPAAMDDGRRALEWLSENAEGHAQLAANPRRGFIVGGFSSGARIAVVLVTEARDAPLAHPITGTFLALPSILEADMVPTQYSHLWRSREENKDAPSLNKDAVERMGRLLQADPKARLFSPFNNPNGLKGLPSTYIQAGGKDLLRDDAVVYRAVLADAGVPVRLDVMDTMEHNTYVIFSDQANKDLLKPKFLSAMSWLLTSDQSA